MHFERQALFWLIAAIAFAALLHILAPVLLPFAIGLRCDFTGMNSIGMEPPGGTTAIVLFPGPPPRRIFARDHWEWRAEAAI